ncbi:MAG: Rrf2 family transcriptional regulator [Bacteroidetes bacterium]|nr:Rrf2 family transcriptional regulator [Bacteroidota bacterium]MDF1867122.1 Rrf2 family transcriptional regulator [Saprospiraceae bacterium]
MFSKSCKYAIRAVLYLAVHSDESSKIGVKEIADSLEVPKHFLAKILQQLAKHNLIASIKGPSGGFFLTETHINASLIQVVYSMDGPEMFSSCLLGLPVCSSDNPCPLHVQAFAYREGIIYQMKHQTIKELANRIEREELKL